MYAERADAVIVRVSGQEMRKPWQKNYKGGPQQRPPMQVKQNGETSAQGTSSPALMELGMAHQRTPSKEDYQKLREENACFYCHKPNVGHVACDCPLKEKRQGKGPSH